MAAKILVRKTGRRRTVASMSAATATVLAVGFAAPAVVPDAEALSLDAVTSGPLFGLIDAFGIHSLSTPDLPVVGTLTLNLDHVNADPANVYGAINAIPFSESANRPTLVLADGQGAFATATAYQRLIAASQGNTPRGYSPLTPGSADLVNQTNEVLGLLWNPTRPNGGLYARFAPLASLFGVDTVLSPGGVPSGQATGIKLNTTVLDLTTAYNGLGDFPVTLNPFALANSLMATLPPTFLLGGGQMMGLDTTDALINIASTLTLGHSALTGGTFFGTFLPNDLPLLEPLRLPVRIVNAVSERLGIPLKLPTLLADALQPAATILVNIGYPDVQTPSEGGTYNRTFDEAGVPTPFLSVQPLTFDEWLQVPGDVIEALIGGFAAQIRKIFGVDDADAAPDVAVPLAAQGAEPTDDVDAPDEAGARVEGSPVEGMAVAAESDDPSDSAGPDAPGATVPDVPLSDGETEVSSATMVPSAAQAIEPTEPVNTVDSADPAESTADVSLEEDTSDLAELDTPGSLEPPAVDPPPTDSLDSATNEASEDEPDPMTALGPKLEDSGAESSGNDDAQRGTDESENSTDRDSGRAA